MNTTGIIWAGLHCEDIERQLAFYAGVLGMPVYERGPDYVLLDCGGGEFLELWLEGQASSGTKGPKEQPVRIAFQVPDLDAAIAELQGRVEFLGDIGSHQNHRWINMRDPEGNRVELKEVR